MNYSLLTTNRARERWLVDSVLALSASINSSNREGAAKCSLEELDLTACDMISDADEADFEPMDEDEETKDEPAVYRLVIAASQLANRGRNESRTKGG
jgi:hypothetical protein